MCENSPGVTTERFPTEKAYCNKISVNSPWGCRARVRTRDTYFTRPLVCYAPLISFRICFADSYGSHDQEAYGGSADQDAYSGSNDNAFDTGSSFVIDDDTPASKDPAREYRLDEREKALNAREADLQRRYCAVRHRCHIHTHTQTYLRTCTPTHTRTQTRTVQ